MERSCLFSSFTSKARGVAVLMNKNKMFKLNSVEKDKTGRFLLIDCYLNINRVTLINIYDPNQDDPTFFSDLLLRLVAFQGDCLKGGQ